MYILPQTFIFILKGAHIVRPVKESKNKQRACR